MFARVSTYRAPDPEQFVTSFEGTREPLTAMDGFADAYVLVDRAGGKAMTITLWESEEALSASVARADELRRQAADTGGGSIEAVEHYEVALHIGGAAASSG